ncbi:GNAT family protein [Bacillus atrophaeus]|uniref:GNAT family N-acetyltransferase n=1 Tax=Bacillus atrophaeus TaxID=1452 RepID=UPI00123A3E83|nr:GNAT family N-acetyltransferase [Bacillus atrophaeus]KAA6450213.1 hypothetical protein DX926_12160 [Bacillus atrophaeus]
MFTETIEKNREELKEELNQLEIQMYRMQENIKDISKDSRVLGIDQSKDEDWLIVSSIDDGQTCKIMLTDCETAYRGRSRFSLVASYQNDAIHIGDIKGPPNLGYGSICIKFLKEIARDHNIPKVTGDIAKRDWDHVERLIHFYEKHHFEVSIDCDSQSGEIKWVDL